ncbi:MAG: hypothetical protein WA418_09550 [Bradyrhizobium sp.]
MRTIVALAISAALAAHAAAFGLVVAPAAAEANRAADYPSRTIRIIVSAPPAGGPDIVSRLLADKLQQRWGQAVVVEIRAHLARMSMTPIAGTPADMAHYIKSETRRWGDVIRAAKITMH